MNLPKLGHKRRREMLYVEMILKEIAPTKTIKQLLIDNGYNVLDRHIESDIAQTTLLDYAYARENPDCTDVKHRDF
jgi:hypothetical protein